MDSHTLVLLRLDELADKLGKLAVRGHGRRAAIGRLKQRDDDVVDQLDDLVLTVNVLKQANSPVACV